MKIFYFYDSCEDSIKLKTQFENNLPYDLEPFPYVVENNFCQKTHGGGYYGWLCKYNTVLNGFQNTNKDEYFLFSDIDIKFYKSINSIILDQEWYFQQETANGTDINIGFMIIKNCSNSINFWKTSNNLIEQYKYLSSNECYKIKHKKGNGSGQFIINDLLSDYNHLNWGRLPLEFWSKSIGFDFLSKDIILHHANAVHGCKKKFDQLEYISQILSRL